MAVVWIVALTWCNLSAAAADSAAVENAYRALLRDTRVQGALRQIRADDAATLQEQIAIAQIPSPPFKESTRATQYLQRLRELGLSDASIDPEGNVLARRKGRYRRPLLVLSAHLDSVFPEGTDVTVHEERGRYSGKGITDDARGLAANLAILRALQHGRLMTVGDILFVGTVGEEGLGNLRGAKALFRDFPDIDGFISIDGTMPPDGNPATGSSIVTQATGSRRWKIEFTGPGGHSFQNFGLPSATHALGRAIARIADLRTSEEPKTTFTVGIVSGGTAVNAIAAEAQMEIDMRSNDAAALIDLENRIMAAVDAGVADENARWKSSAMRATRELLGDRPAGSAPQDTPMIRSAVQAWLALGQRRPALVTSSTDSNVAISLGVPAVTLDGGGIGDKAHSPDEWYEPRESWLGPQAAMLTALGLVGVDGLSKPLLGKLAGKR